MGRKKYQKKKKEKPIRVNPELEGFDLKINSFGEIHSNYDIDEINKFLNKNLKDKKLTKKQIEKNTGQKKNKEKD